MTAEPLMALDLLATVITAAGWLGAGAAAATRRPRTALALFVVALLASLARAGLVIALANAGWWFVQEKVTITMPLLAITALTATILATPPLLAAARATTRRDAQGQHARTHPDPAHELDAVHQADAVGRADAVRQADAVGRADAVRQTDAEHDAVRQAEQVHQADAVGQAEAVGRAEVIGGPVVVVPLLTAGYAAVAGLVITLLIGYPATWSTGLITAALVAGAALASLRITPAPASASMPAPALAEGPSASEPASAPAFAEGPSASEPASAPVPARGRGPRAGFVWSFGGVRGVLAVVVAVGLVGVGLAFVPGEDVDTGGGTADHAMGEHAMGQAMVGQAMSGQVMGGRGAGGTAVGALRGPAAPAPGRVVRRFALTARTATVVLASGRRVAAWTFNGQVPGPPITATEGDLIEVRLRNADIKAGVTLHWHGYDVPSGEDGVPGLTQEAVRPGQEFVYRFRADQVGTYWYHTHEVSDQGVKMGLYGALVVAPRPPAAGEGVDSASSSGAGEGASPATGVDLTLPVHTFAGLTVFGDSDRPIERTVAAGTPVRLRLINTDSTPHRFTLAGVSYRLVAIDGTDLNGPGPLDKVGLRLPAGGRYDLEFTMPANGTNLLADNRVSGVRLTPEGYTGPAAENTAAWPELDPTRYGTPAATPFGAGSHADRHFTLVLDRGLALVDGTPMYAHTVNGRAFPSIPTEVVAEGELVRFTVVNRSRDTHPWHLHGHRVLVLARDGRAPTGSPLWLDTFDVRPGEVWEVAFRASNPGLWMNHCHNLSHADQGMALHLAYQGVTTTFHGAHGG